MLQVPELRRELLERGPCDRDRRQEFRMTVALQYLSRDPGRLEAELLAGLETYAPQIKGDQPKGIIHCFTGTYEFGRRCVELGFYISFSGIITFKKADDLRRCAMDFPLEQILVETDSPYLAPIPFRGKKCEPSMVKLTAQKIAEIRKISFDDVAQATTKNAKRVFRI